MNHPENSSPTDHPGKISIQPRLSNHQTQDRPAAGEPDFQGLILQLTRVLEDFRADKKPTPVSIDPEEVPRIRQSGQLPVRPSEGEGSKRRRRRRRSDDGKPVPEFEKYLPGSRRRRERRRKAILLIIAVVVAFAASNYTVAKFFYRSGVAEGMTRGLAARAAVAGKTASPPAAGTRAGFAANLMPPESSPKPAETKKPAP